MICLSAFLSTKWAFHMVNASKRRERRGRSWGGVCDHVYNTESLIVMFAKSAIHPGSRPVVLGCFALHSIFLRQSLVGLLLLLLLLLLWSCSCSCSCSWSPVAVVLLIVLVLIRNPAPGSLGFFAQDIGYRIQIFNSKSWINKFFNWKTPWN